MKTYRVRLERDKDGYWVATVPAIAGCHTQAKSLRQVRSRVSEAILASLDDDRTALDLSISIRLPKRASAALARADRRSRTALVASQAASQAKVKAVRFLTRQGGLSLRDVAELVGLSHQRVHQILGVRGTQPRRR